MLTPPLARPPRAFGARVKPALDAVWNLLRAIPDPEIPVISIVDLGIVRDVRWDDDTLVVAVTPTYSGCPATAVIHEDIARALAAAGVEQSRIEIQLAPAWTTDWIADEARERLRVYGIAPPGRCAPPGVSVIDVSGLSRHRHADVACPRCGSTATELVSRFGSTPCQSQYRCRACAEPFDHFKPH